MARKRFNLTDIVSLTYIAWVLFIVLAFYGQVRYYYLYALAYGAYAVYIFFITRLYQRHPENRLIAFLRFCYPVITLWFTYRSITGFVTVLFGKFIDPVVLDFQLRVFGMHPEIFIDRFSSPAVTELMKFSYFSYYLFMPVTVLVLFFKKRMKELDYFVFMITFMFYFCYIGFVLFPIEGPRFTLAGLYRVKELTGFVFTPLQDFIMHNGQAIGACMPSSHLAVAWSSLFLMRKFFGRKLFYFLLPIVLIMSVSIVYNRYHYVADAVMGILVAAVFYPLARKWYLKAEGPVEKTAVP